MNTVCISGNLVRDAVQNGERAMLTVAINRKWKNSEGQIVEATDYIPVAISATEKQMQYLTKGTHVEVTGTLNSYTKEDRGENRTSIIVSARDVRFVGGKREESQSQEQEPTVEEMANL